jgi:hypothetical protein
MMMLCSPCFEYVVINNIGRLLIQSFRSYAYSMSYLQKQLLVVVVPRRTNIMSEEQVLIVVYAFEVAK